MVSLRLVTSSFLIISAIAQTPRDFPLVQGETFAGREIELPDAAKGKVAVLIFGFTKASSKPTSAWAKKIAADFGGRQDFELYQLAVLEDVPRLLRGMVISGIKKGVPENQRDHFVPVLQGEKELKRAVDYTLPDAAYLVIFDRGGKEVAQLHGSPDDANYSQMRRQLESLLK